MVFMPHPTEHKYRQSLSANLASHPVGLNC